jgi:ribosomal protein S18 acetylase RimI-like enzyme
MLAYSLNSVYIMTLGVVDELRSTGLARRLLQELYNFIASKPRIKMVTLHVVAYNKRAIAFYRKNGYRLLESITDHYHIMGKEYEGLKLGLFVNGGQVR